MRRSDVLTVVLFVLLMTAADAFASSDCFRVDKDYYPSLIQWERSNAAFTEPGVCQGCHPGSMTSGT